MLKDYSGGTLAAKLNVFKYW